MTSFLVCRHPQEHGLDHVIISCVCTYVVRRSFFYRTSHFKALQLGQFKPVILHSMYSYYCRPSVYFPIAPPYMVPRHILSCFLHAAVAFHPPVVSAFVPSLWIHMIAELPPAKTSRCSMYLSIPILSSWCKLYDADMHVPQSIYIYIHTRICLTACISTLELF